MVRGAEYADKLRQKTALNILKRRELRRSLDLTPNVHPSIDPLPERIGYTVRHILKKANNPQAKELLEKLQGSPVLDKVFYLRRSKLTKKAARETLDNRKDLRTLLLLEKPHHAEKTRSVGLTDLLVTAGASEAAQQIYTSRGHMEGERWVPRRVTGLAREDAEAALAIMEEEAMKR